MADAHENEAVKQNMGQLSNENPFGFSKVNVSSRGFSVTNHIMCNNCLPLYGNGIKVQQ